MSKYRPFSILGRFLRILQLVQHAEEPRAEFVCCLAKKQLELLFHVLSPASVCHHHQHIIGQFVVDIGAELC